MSRGLNVIACLQHTQSALSQHHAPHWHLFGSCWSIDPQSISLSPINVPKSSVCWGSRDMKAGEAPRLLLMETHLSYSCFIRLAELTYQSWSLRIKQHTVDLIHTMCEPTDKHSLLDWSWQRSRCFCSSCTDHKGNSLVLGKKWFGSVRARGLAVVGREGCEDEV